MNIVTAIKNGDEFIFQQVFNQYHAKLYFFIFNKTQSEYLTEEVVQITFIKLWKFRHNLNEDFTISTQIFRIASTTLIDLLRKQNTLQALSNELKSLNTDIGANNTAEKIDEKEVSKKLLAVVECLPPMQRKVFKMSRFEGMQYKEIASALSISTKTVETHISKALRQLRKYLQVLWLIIITITFF